MNTRRVGNSLPTSTNNTKHPMSMVRNKLRTLRGFDEFF